MCEYQRALINEPIAELAKMFKVTNVPQLEPVPAETDWDNHYDVVHGAKQGSTPEVIVIII